MKLLIIYLLFPKKSYYFIKMNNQSELLQRKFEIMLRNIRLRNSDI